MKTTRVGPELIRKGFFRVSVESGYIVEDQIDVEAEQIGCLEKQS